MSGVVRFVVPGAPVGKGRARIGKVGNHARMFTPPKTASYEGLIAHAGHAAMAGRPLIEGAVLVVLDICIGVPASWSKRKQAAALAGQVYPTTKPDKDNIIKAIYDGLNGVVWKDDVQVVEGIQRKRYGAVPGVTVEIEELRAGA